MLTRVLFRNSTVRHQLISLSPGARLPFRELDATFHLLRKIRIGIPRNEHRIVALEGSWSSGSATPWEYDLDIQMRPLANTPAALRTLISLFIQKSRREFDRLFKSNDDSTLVVKYMPAARLADFLQRGQLYASGTPGFTWGDAVYVVPTKFPFSSMMYGCVGIVGEIQPKVVFDGSDNTGIQLYQQWIRTQFRWYDLLTTTMHSDIANRMLRNRFRTEFAVDCVFFRPDQVAPGYVSRHNDRWFAVSHWVGSAQQRVGPGFSPSIINPEFCAVLSEEFDNSKGPILYRPLLGAQFRARNSTPVAIRPGDASFGAELERLYRQVRADRRSGRTLAPICVTHEIS